MRKKIIDKIYIVLLLTTIFSSSYIMLCDMDAKDVFSCVDTNIELLEDSSMADSSETSLEEITETVNSKILVFDLQCFFSLSNAYFYIQNIYQIYLGHNTPPPKYL